ncbi:MAG TPA: hypothetical protein VFV65_07155 [Gemmatimonadales bacterium]|nr:hypothetical protein [Gemmatimonadales bacterium]
MFRVILANQWRESRIAILFLAATAVAIPSWSLWGTTPGPWEAWHLLNAAQQSSLAYPLLALLAALTLAAGAWRPDHRARHVYALTLPVPRSRYLLLRYAAGLLLLACLGMALAVGAGAATVGRTLPRYLEAHPLLLAGRFVLAGVSAYTLLFAVSGITARTARLLVAGLLLLLAVSAAADLLGLDWNPLARCFEALMSPYGPLAPFRWTWMLIDV